jgi:hypothetical protein
LIFVWQQNDQTHLSGGQVFGDIRMEAVVIVNVASQFDRFHR